MRTLFLFLFLVLSAFPARAGDGQWKTLQSCGAAEIQGYGFDADFSTATIFKSQFRRDAASDLWAQGCAVVSLGCNVCSRLNDICPDGAFDCPAKVICSSKTCMMQTEAPSKGDCSWKIALTSCKIWRENEDAGAYASADIVPGSRKTIVTPVAAKKRSIEKAIPVFIPVEPTTQASSE